MDVKLFRFAMPKGMRALIEAFDRGEPLTAKNASFVLLPPGATETLDGKDRQRRARRERQRQAALLGESVEVGASSSNKVRPQSKPLVIDLAVRDGRGMAQFKQKS